VIVLVVLPLVLPGAPAGAPPCAAGTCTLLRVLVLVMSLVCSGSSILQRPYLLFLVACPSARDAPL
jgi:hypothetical protein